MSYTIEELNPLKPVLVIDDREIIISLITLHKEVIFKEKYGSLSKVFDAIKEKPEEIINVIWILTINKKEFGFSLEELKKFIFTSKQSILEWSKDMHRCLNESISKSMPLIKNQKRYKEIQEIKGSTTDTEPCYAGYFDTIAKRYGGYDLDKFYELTLRQLHMLLSTIGDKQYEELEVQASLHGRKLKPRMTFEDISEEQEKEQEQQALEALKRLQDEYKERMKNG